MGGMVVLGAMQAGSKVAEGHAQQAAYKIEAQQAGLEAKTDELDRREMLQDALAMQAVITGASGRAAGEGSPLAIREADIARAGEDIAMIKAGGRAKSAALRSAGQTAKTTSITSGLLSAAQTGYQAKQVK